MAKINLKVQKRLQPKEQLLSNKSIVMVKITAACILLLGCSMFFFANMQLFWSDLKRISPFPFVFFGGLIWIAIYIVNLAGHIDDNELHHADRRDLLYKVVFVLTVLSMVFRSFVFKDLAVHPEITIICIISGVITLATPRILDNNNDEF